MRAKLRICTISRLGDLAVTICDLILCLKIVLTDSYLLYPFDVKSSTKYVALYIQNYYDHLNALTKDFQTHLQSKFYKGKILVKSNFFCYCFAKSRSTP